MKQFLTSYVVSLLNKRRLVYIFSFFVILAGLLVAFVELLMEREISFSGAESVAPKSTLASVVDSASLNILLLAFRGYYCSLTEKLPLVEECQIKPDFLNRKIDVKLQLSPPSYFIMLNDTLYAVDRKGRQAPVEGKNKQPKYLFFVDENSYSRFFTSAHFIISKLVEVLGDFCHGIVSTNLVRIKFCGFPSITFYSIDWRDLEQSFNSFEQRILPRLHRIKSATEIQVNFDGSASVLIE